MLKRLLPDLLIRDELGNTLEAVTGGRDYAAIIVTPGHRSVGLDPMDCRALATRLNELADAYRFPDEDEDA